ncbi:regucalcin-like [Oratosquilla oratoria]|uniref:regucalcin-like n=1 Tax=Oratosquilla oratoria TaxID=337810 RepID=UPI003F762D2E
MSTIHIEQVVGPLNLGEGPHWVEEDQALVFVDAFKGDIHRYFPSTQRHQVLHVDDVGTGTSTTVIVPIEGLADHYVITIGRSIGVIAWKPSDPDQHTVKPKVLLHFDAHCPTNFFNDGKCDSKGRLWAGTRGCELEPDVIDLHKGTLYRIDHDLKTTACTNKLSISNGLIWSKDLTLLYYIDSCVGSVDVFDYTHETGEIKNRRVLLDYKTQGWGKDVPDGMTIDTDGNLWVANFFGQKVICVDPKEGRVVRTVPMPCKNITSVCWGGPNYDVLYVTSAQEGLTAEELKAQPQAGATFAITGLGVKGKPSPKFKADLNILKAKMTEDGK